MNPKNGLWLVLLALVIVITDFQPLSAQTKKVKSNVGRKIDSLQRKIDILSEEVDQLKTSSGKGDSGKTKKKTTIGGYGELHYNGRTDPADTDRLDFHRLVLFIGHRFNDWIVFNSEIEIEHSGIETGTEGEVRIEQAYLDFMAHDYLNVRGGMILVPLGIINETHEPPTFHGVERPNVETRIIPSTWNELGIGIFGKLPLEGFQYKVYLMNSMDISSGTEIRNWRQRGTNNTFSKIRNIAITGRLEYSISQPFGLKLGGSWWYGKIGQQKFGGASPGLFLFNFDLRFNWRGLEIRGLFAQGSLSKAENYTSATGTTVSKKFFGYYGEIAYNVLSLIDTDHYLAPFIRFEEYNREKELSNGSTPDGKKHFKEVTLGLSYRPTPGVAIKADYQLITDGNNQTKVYDQWNLGLGFMF